MYRLGQGGGGGIFPFIKTPRKTNWRFFYPLQTRDKHSSPFCYVLSSSLKLNKKKHTSSSLLLLFSGPKTFMAIPLPEKRFSLSKKTLWRKLQGRKFLPFFLDCRRRHESFFLYLLPFPHIYTSAEFPYQLRTYIRTTNTTSRQKSKHVLVRTKRGRRKRDEQKRPFWHNKVFGCFSFSSLPHALFLVLIRIGKKISFSRKSFVGGRLCQKRLLPLFFYLHFSLSSSSKSLLL